MAHTSRQAHETKLPRSRLNPRTCPRRQWDCPPPPLQGLWRPRLGMTTPRVAAKGVGLAMRTASPALKGGTLNQSARGKIGQHFPLMRCHKGCVRRVIAARCRQTCTLEPLDRHLLHTRRPQQPTTHTLASSRDQSRRTVSECRSVWGLRAEDTNELSEIGRTPLLHYAVYILDRKVIDPRLCMQSRA